jgi:hypothetical protein
MTARPPRSREFRLALGESPYAYLMTRRIERAMALSAHWAPLPKRPSGHVRKACSSLAAPATFHGARDNVRRLWIKTGTRCDWRHRTGSPSVG